MTNNTKKNKSQYNYTIEHEMNFDNKFILYRGTKYPLPVVTVSLRVGQKKRETMICGLIFLSDSGATGRMIKRTGTKQYKHKMQYNKLEYSKDTGTYCTTYDVKVTFCMP